MNIVKTTLGWCLQRTLGLKKEAVIIMPIRSLATHGNQFTKNTMRLQAEWFLVVTISLLNMVMTRQNTRKFQKFRQGEALIFKA